PGKRYTVEDTQTGKRITFEWHGSAPPTDADIEAVFQAAGLRSAASAPAASGGVLDALGDFASGLWSTVNPIEVVRSLGAAVSDPIGTTRAIGQAQGRLGVEAAQAFQEGDYWRAARKGIHYLLPLLGPALDQSSESLLRGDTARGLGEATGVGLGT